MHAHKMHARTLVHTSILFACNPLIHTYNMHTYIHKYTFACNALVSKTLRGLMSPVYVCIYVCIYVCVYVCMHVCVCVCMVCTRENACMYFMYARVCVCLSPCLYVCNDCLYACMHVCIMCMCTHTCTYVFMSVCTYDCCMCARIYARSKYLRWCSGQVQYTKRCAQIAQVAKVAYMHTIYVLNICADVADECNTHRDVHK
jgi:hypothetical protein